MNAEYKRLKKEYDEIGVEIQKLHEKQNEVHGLIQEACTHGRYSEVQPYYPMDFMGSDDEETKYKCKDCYRYFTKEEFDSHKVINLLGNR